MATNHYDEFVQSFFLNLVMTMLLISLYQSPFMLGSCILHISMDSRINIDSVMGLQIGLLAKNIQCQVAIWRTEAQANAVFLTGS